MAEDTNDNEYARMEAFMDHHNEPIQRFREMLIYMRPSGTDTEEQFAEAFLYPHGFTRDPHKNLVLRIGDNPTVLWSSHIDTVHRQEGFQRTQILYTPDTCEVGLHPDQLNSIKPSCLGADCTTGVYLMVEMVKAKVPGLYIIHHGEESGCIGSYALAQHSPDTLAGIKYAIAFDRKGTSEVITHQCGSRTASDAFAVSLATLLHDKGLGYTLKPSDGGVYTDTNSYPHIIPECTNLAVGYTGQHSSFEIQDLVYLMALKNALVTLTQDDIDTLVVARDPSDDPYDGYGSFYGRSSSKYGGSRSYGYYDSDLYNRNTYKSVSSALNRSKDPYYDFVRDNPGIVQELLMSFGITLSDLHEAYEQQYGIPFDEPSVDEEVWDNYNY